jgi:hypothetical protein
MRCATLLCSPCSVGGRCERCRRRDGRRRLAGAIVVVSLLVGIAGAAVVSARGASPPGAAARQAAIADARSYAEAHPCDATMLQRALERLHAYEAPLDVSVAIVRVNAWATCPPMPAFEVTAFWIAMEAKDFPLARVFVDRAVQHAHGDGERWVAFELQEALGLATGDARLVRLAREGFQSIRPTAAYANALAKPR